MNGRDAQDGSIRVPVRVARPRLPTGQGVSGESVLDAPWSGPLMTVSTVYPPRTGMYRHSAAGSRRKPVPEGPPLVELYGAGNGLLRPGDGPFVVRTARHEARFAATLEEGGPWTLPLGSRHYELWSPDRMSTVVRRPGPPAAARGTAGRVDRALSPVLDTAGLAVLLATAGQFGVDGGGGEPRSAVFLQGAEDVTEEALLCLLSLVTVVGPFLGRRLGRRLPGPVRRFLTEGREQGAASRPGTVERFWQVLGPQTAPEHVRRGVRPPWTESPWPALPGAAGATSIQADR